jgi:hypothetical protein
MTISAKQADGNVMPEAGDTYQDPHAQVPSLEHCRGQNLREPCSNSKDGTELLLVGLLRTPQPSARGPAESLHRR